LRRDHAPDSNHDVGAALAVKRGAQLRHECQMSGGKRRDAKDMDIVLGRLARGFLGRGKQWSGDNLEAKSVRAEAITF